MDYDSVSDYLMGQKPALVSTGGYSPSNMNMSFNPNPQPQLVSSYNPARFDKQMSLIGDGNTNTLPPPTPGMTMTDKLNTGANLFNSVLGAVGAYHAYKLGKENLAFQKDAFYKNFDAQKGLTNSQLADRQARRVAERPNSFASVAEYMDKYGVK